MICSIVEEKPINEIGENVNVEKKATKRRISKSNDFESDDVLNCNKKKDIETKCEVKKNKGDDADQLSKRKQICKIASNTMTLSKAKRSQRVSCSPEPEEEVGDGDDQQVEQQGAQIEARTSSGRRKVIF